MEAIQVELRRMKEERDHAVLQSQHMAQEVSRLSAEKEEMRKSSEEKAATQDQAHRKEMQLLKSKHEDNLNTLKHDNTALRQQVDRLLIGADEGAGDDKKTTINLPERPKRALLADDCIDSSLLTGGVKRSADDASMSSEAMPNPKNPRVEDDTDIPMDDAPPKNLHTTHKVNFSSKDVPRRKKSRPARIIKCTQCIVHKQPCDASEPCKHCVDRKVACKRTKCKNFQKGTCLNKNCTFAHEGDDFENLVPFRKIKSLEADGRSKKATAQKKKEEEDGSAYDGLFAVIARQRRKGGKGDGDDMDTTT